MKQIRQVLAPIITVLMWCATIVLTTLTISFVFGYDQSVWVITAISTLLMTLTTLIWMPTGIELGEKVTKVHNNTEIHTNRANYIVDNQMFKQADAFCDYKNEQYAKKLKVKKMAKILVGFDDYLKYENLYKKNILKNCTKKDREDFANFKQGFTEKQIKEIEKLITNGVSFVPLTPDDLTKFHDTKGRLKPKNTEYMTRNIRLIAKIVWGIMLGIGTVGLIVTQNTFGWEQVLQLTIWTISILSNLFTSIWTSYRSVVINRNNYLIEKNDLCAEFFSYCNIKVTEIDKMVEDRLIKND